MCWTRGFLRLWIVATVVWILWSSFTIKPLDAFNAPISAYPDQTRISVLREGGFNDAEIADYARKQELEAFAAWAILPPLALLSLGFALAWAFVGFRVRHP